MSFFKAEDFGDHPTHGEWCAGKANAKRDAELERLRAENAELQRKGESLCCQNGTLLMDTARLREALEWALGKIIPQSLPTAERTRYDVARAALEGK